MPRRRCSTSTRCRSCSRSYRIGLTFGVLAAVAARHRHRRRSVAGRCPLADLPAVGRRRILGVARRRRARRRLHRRQRRPRWRQPAVRRPVPGQPHRRAPRSRRGGRIAGGDGAHHPRAGHEHAPGAAVQLGRSWSVRWGLLLLLPSLIGALIFTYIDYRYGRVGFGGNQAINGWIGFGSTQPATFVVRRPGVRLRRRSDRRGERPQAADARDGVHGHRPARHHCGTRRSAAAACRPVPRHLPHVRRPVAQRRAALRLVQPRADPRWLDRLGGRRDGACVVGGRGSRRRSCSDCSAC